MISVSTKGVWVFGGRTVISEEEAQNDGLRRGRLEKAELGHLADRPLDREAGRRGTISYQILSAHDQGSAFPSLRLRFDALASHDITYVGVIQTARASGLEEFPVPYALTNCHNSLCAVGGTINEDDHLFGLSAARKYGGIFVPPHQAVIHQYVREMMAGCGKMILASDSHTRYGALGTMGIGEGGPEIVKQLLGRTYDIPYPEVVAVLLKGRPADGVGPQDVALALIRAVFASGAVKNKVLEFIGPGVSSLSVDFRNGIDVMTTETACLSSIWRTDEAVKGWYETHGRLDQYLRLEPQEAAYYDGVVEVDLAAIVPMIALPFHPSNAWPIAELNRHGREILREVEAQGRRQIENPALEFRLSDKLVDGRLKVDQGSVVGCAGGTFGNLVAMAAIMEGRAIGSGEFSLNVYPASQPIYLELCKNGAVERLLTAGVVVRTAFCGPCFGAGDTPAHGALSIRHATRNFPHREGSKPTEGQMASVALMDARSIAATAVNGGLLTPATEIGFVEPVVPYRFSGEIYERRVYQGFGKPKREEPLRLGPNIADWPAIPPLAENLLLVVASVIKDPVTTTDELIPSGETSSFRSNPLRLAEFTLSRKDPSYVGRAKVFQDLEKRRRGLASHGGPLEGHLKELFSKIAEIRKIKPEDLGGLFKETAIGTAVAAVRPGDGSAREQAVSCQKVLGGQANIACEYATKRYRSNLINWGMLPFTVSEEDFQGLAVGDLIFLEGIRHAVERGEEKIAALQVGGEKVRNLTLRLEGLTHEDRRIILAGCLMNFYALPEEEAVS